MSAAVDAAAQWTPRTPLEALASVCICDEEDEDDYASDNWTAARDARRCESTGIRLGQQVLVLAPARARRRRCCVVRGGAEIRGRRGARGYWEVRGRRSASHSVLCYRRSVLPEPSDGRKGSLAARLLKGQADAIIHDATIGVGCVIGKGQLLGLKQAVLKDYCVQTPLGAPPSEFCQDHSVPGALLHRGGRAVPAAGRGISLRRP